MRITTLLAAIAFVAFAFVAVPVAQAQQSGWTKCINRCKGDPRVCQIRCRNS
jgi:hypothetical protein